MVSISSKRDFWVGPLVLSIILVLSGPTESWAKKKGKVIHSGGKGAVPVHVKHQRSQRTTPTLKWNRKGKASNLRKDRSDRTDRRLSASREQSRRPDALNRGKRAGPVFKKNPSPQLRVTPFDKRPSRNIWPAKLDSDDRSFTLPSLPEETTAKQ